MEKVDSTQEQMGKVSREMGILRKNWKEMLEIKNSVIEMKNAFYGLISRLTQLRKKISQPENISTESLKTEKQKEKRVRKKNRR